jgi:hypothetical protein
MIVRCLEASLNATAKAWVDEHKADARAVLVLDGWHYHDGEDGLLLIQACDIVFNMDQYKLNIVVVSNGCCAHAAHWTTVPLTLERASLGIFEPVGGCRGPGSDGGGSTCTLGGDGDGDSAGGSAGGGAGGGAGVVTGNFVVPNALFFSSLSDGVLQARVVALRLRASEGLTASPDPESSPGQREVHPGPAHHLLLLSELLARNPGSPIEWEVILSVGAYAKDFHAMFSVSAVAEGRALFQRIYLASLKYPSSTALRQHVGGLESLLGVRVCV